MALMDIIDIIGKPSHFIVVEHLGDAPSVCMCVFAPSPLVREMLCVCAFLPSPSVREMSRMCVFAFTLTLGEEVVCVSVFALTLKKLIQGIIRIEGEGEGVVGEGRWGEGKGVGE